VLRVGSKADVLFFLHTFNRVTPWKAARPADAPPTAFKYVIHYADGQTADVPIYAETDVDDFKQRSPAAIPGAQIAWVKPYAGTEFSAVVYSKQWNNPRPDVAIRSVDLVYGAPRRGVPALLALTAATAAR
jgi:beta-galactosidase